MSATTEPKHEHDHHHHHGPHCNHNHNHSTKTGMKKHHKMMVFAGVLFTIGYLIWTFIYSPMLTQ